MEQSFRIVGLGEVLWDVFPDQIHFGGAAANYACHAQMLGGQVSLVSCVGQDSLGEQAVDFLKQRQIDTSAVAQSSSYPTGTVQITLDSKGKPDFEIKADVAWDFIPWTEQVEKLALQTEAVCFGSLGQRSATSQQTIHQLLKATSEDCLRIFDINLRQDYYNSDLIESSLELSEVLKLNDDELAVVSSIFGLTGTQIAQIEQLKKRFSLQLVALTRGEKGSVLVADEGIFEHSGLAVGIQDTVGAGDAFTATLTIGLLQQSDLQAVNEHANRVAAYVCSQAGAAPILPSELLQFS